MMIGNQGDDTLHGGPGDDVVRGGKDNDIVNGNDGNDIVVGGNGDDTVYGNQGDDTVYGGDGNDIVGGGKGMDNVYADSGNDQIYGGNDDDRLWGGTGNDVFHYSAGHGNDIIFDFQWSADQLRLYDVTFVDTTQLDSDCRVNLSTGATILLVDVGVCYNPTISFVSNQPSAPMITTDRNLTENIVTVSGYGLAANESVSITVDGMPLSSLQTDANGIFTYTLPTDDSNSNEYMFVAPASYFFEDGIYTEVSLVATVDKSE